jgi:hypothetical protein
MRSVRNEGARIFGRPDDLTDSRPAGAGNPRRLDLGGPISNESSLAEGDAQPRNNFSVS